MDLPPLVPMAPSTVTAAGGVAVRAADGEQEALPAQNGPPARHAVLAAVAQANASLAAKDVGIEFTIDPDTKGIVVRMIDRDSQTVLRQVPSPEMLAIAKALDRMQGLLLRNEA